MANLDAPKGLQSYGGEAQVHYYEASVTTAIFKGDVVAIKSSGRAHTVVTTTGSVYTVGVAAEYSKASNTPAQRIAVWDDPDQRFVVQDDGLGATTAHFNKNRIGETFTLTLLAGDTSTGLSKQELDISQAGLETTDPLKVIDVVQAIDNSSGESHMKWVVLLQRHFLAKVRAGV